MISLPFTSHDVFCALEKQALNAGGLGGPAPRGCTVVLEPMAQRAKVLTATHFGNSVGLYTPLYIANFCVNALRVLWIQL
ncbi:MAG: hypothetical protein ACLR23_28465 [Clostridia bacterium]